MQPKSIVEIFSDNCRRFASRPCFQFKKKERWGTISWDEAFQRVKELSLGLASLGVSKGDGVVIFSATSVEWTLCDLAILSLGAVTVPIYQSSTPEQLAYIVNDSEAKVLFVEGDAQLK
ncbi:MAG: AMP-binding protein, partial [Deltaproteobacteria bacterium]|nr:AMP-binding protein [Deltaproteobacteria bacterium]